MMQKPRRAISIRQPYVEQILRGKKKIEYRSIPTNIRERVFIYASLRPGPEEDFIAADLDFHDLPTGVIAGSIEIVDCTGRPGDYHWHLARPQRAKRLRKPKKHPQPVWFIPF